MEMKRKNRILLLFVIINLTSCLGKLSGKPVLTNKTENEMVNEVHVGVILDMGSLEGKILQRCISMAISDFYSVHDHYKTRLVLHTRDSKGETLNALSAAVNLLEHNKVGAILGAQTSTEAKVLAELGNKNKVPVVSFHPPNSPSSINYPYFVEIAQDESSQVKSIASVVEAFKWRNVILVYEDNYDWKDLTPYIVDYLQDKEVHIVRKTAIAMAYEDDQIIEKLHELMALQTSVFVVHMSHSLVTRLFLNAKKIGMISEGYAWILTANSMNLLHFKDLSVLESMQGVVGFKYYVPESEKLQNFTSRWRRTFFAEEPKMEAIESSVLAMRAYDVAWCLAKAAERAWNKIPLIRSPTQLNLRDLHSMRTSVQGSKFLKEILHSKFKGLSGEFQFSKGKLVSNTLEIVNVIGRVRRRVGYWISDGKITKRLHSSNDRRYLLSSSSEHHFEPIIWPGGSASIPRGWTGSRKKLKIGVLQNAGFPELVKVHLDPQTNMTTATGFCIDVFKAALEALEYEVEYEFIPFMKDSEEVAGAYNDIIYQVYLQKYDAAVGDITITPNRSLYVDFTLPYTDLGVGMIAPKDNKNIWIFLRPLTADLWLSIAGLFISIGFVVWLIERPINKEFQGPMSHQIGMIFWFSFSTLVFAHREKLLSNLSRFVVSVWVFVVLILTSSYTATLTSMMTVKQIRLKSEKNYIGYQNNSIIHGVVSNQNFDNYSRHLFSSPKAYADALSKGSKSGGVSAIIDEIPYLKIFLAKFSKDFSLIGSMTTTSGFGFAFPQGSQLARDISTEIVKMRQEGKLIMMEDAWFTSQATFTWEDSSDSVSPLTIDSFRGLFLISGTCSGLALFMFLVFVLYKKWPTVC
ncbi:Glutamate receptor 1.1, putative [Theobroma cacao]|uniref:Glutamate receptor n=1 Tax=Theobroma cacao TaxID=3641 RepID=A0A061DUR5_THECC|nr:Glutamate receptor 1.1, putative [Theobroma cacao]